MKIKEILILNMNKMFVLVLLIFVCVALHNIISGLIWEEEPVFFTLAMFVIPLYILISAIYTFLHKIVRAGYYKSSK